VYAPPTGVLVPELGAEHDPLYISKASRLQGLIAFQSVWFGYYLKLEKRWMDGMKVFAG
jgi:hypothetical protein